MQCARGGCAYCFKNRGAPTYRALASACNPAPGCLALCFPSQFCIECAFHSNPQLKWISVGLWALAACADRSTRSKRSQQTVRPSHSVRVARSFQWRQVWVTENYGVEALDIELALLFEGQAAF